MPDNPFAILELEETLFADGQLAETAYRRLIKQWHPDRFASDEKKNAEAVEKTSAINKAFKILSNRDLTAAFWLQQAGMSEGEKLSPHFLMEMMELNETLGEAEMAGDKATINKLTQQVQQLDAELNNGYDDAAILFAAGQKQQALETLKQAYLQKKYILRIKERIVNFAAR